MDFGEVLIVERARVFTGKNTLFEANGTLPVQLKFGSDGLIPFVDETSAITFKALSGDLNQLSKILNTRFNVGWSSGVVQLDIGGSIAEPKITFNGSVEQLEIGDKVIKGGLMVDGAKVAGEWNEKNFSLSSFTGKIAGQQFILNGEVEWPSSWIRELPEQPAWMAAFDTAKFDLLSEKMDLAAVHSVWPSSPVRTGVARVDLKMRTGKLLSGRVEIADGSTFSFGNGERITKVYANLIFKGSMMTIENGQFYFRNRPVTLNGNVDIIDWPNGDMSLNLSAKNFPLVREEQLILRADVAGKIQQVAGSFASIKGEIRLVNSVFMQDLTQFARPGVSGGGMRSPFFSITTGPYRHWKLDVAVQGSDFLRIETPIFRGLSSADVNLTGTLQDPIFAGEFRLRDSLIRFPFGELKVQTGVVSLLPEKGVPQLNLTAMGESFGYTIDLDVSGIATQPQLTFSSSPPLPPEEILLMLTSGVVSQDNGIRDNSGSRATQLAGYIGGSLLSRFSDSMGNNSSLINRIRFEYGTEMTESGQDAFRVEFILTDNWKLYGEYDRFDAYNANVKWEVFELK
jgi:translocation and assembly module TamB